MKTYHRNYIYESNDFENLCKFIVQDNSLKKESFVWHIGRIVDWKYNLSNFKRHFPDNFNKAAHLWFDYFHNLIGFVISEEFDNEFTIFLKNQYSCIYPELLNWVKTEWGNKYDKLVTSALQTQTEYIKFLEDGGYKKSNNLEMTRVFITSLYKDFTIEDSSVSFQSMFENCDYEEQANLRTNAWPKHISGCEAFIDYENNTAEIERVCTHSDFYNRAYAQMILKACMKGLYENNIMTAFIGGTYDKTNHLYGKLGHVKEYARYSFELQTI